MFVFCGKFSHCKYENKPTAKCTKGYQRSPYLEIEFPEVAKTKRDPIKILLC